MPRFMPLLIAVVAIIAWCSPASAVVITRDVNVTLSPTASSGIDSYDLDLDLNGTTDFTFTAAFIPDPFFTVAFATIDVPFGTQNGEVIDAPVGDGFPTVSLLSRGNIVSPSDTFSFGSSDQGNLYYSVPFDPPSGNFAGRTGFVGLRFRNMSGALLYGFAQVTVNGPDAAVNPLGLTIGTVGYETVVGQGVVIPAAPAAVPLPPTAALLALGAVGLLRARRRRAA